MKTLLFYFLIAILCYNVVYGGLFDDEGEGKGEGEGDGGFYYYGGGDDDFGGDGFGGSDVTSQIPQQYMEALYEGLTYFLNKDDYEKLELSEQCSTYVKKYSSCPIAFIETYTPKISEMQEKLTADCSFGTEEFNIETCKATGIGFFNSVCEVYQDDKCKEFLSEDIVTGILDIKSCLTSGDGLKVLTNFAVLKFIQLFLCGKKKNGEYCPITKYITGDLIDYAMKNNGTISKFSASFMLNGGNGENMEDDEEGDNVNADAEIDYKQFIPDGLMDAVGAACRDDECNNYIYTLDTMVIKALQTFKERPIVKEYKNYTDQYNKYMGLFKEKRCSLFDGKADSEPNGVSSVKSMTVTFFTMIIMAVLFLI